MELRIRDKVRVYSLRDNTTFEHLVFLSNAYFINEEYCIIEGIILRNYEVFRDDFRIQKEKLQELIKNQHKEITLLTEMIKKISPEAYYYYNKINLIKQGFRHD